MTVSSVSTQNKMHCEDKLKLSEFKLLARGPYSFDTWRHSKSVKSPLGDFTVVIQLAIGSQPTSSMVIAATSLVEHFDKDKELLSQKVFEEYLAVCADMFAPEWLKGCGVPEGLQLSDLCAFVDQRTLTVDGDLTMTAYLSPKWDEEHGIYFDLIDGRWERSHN